jgi:hypothetical protein
MIQKFKNILKKEGITYEKFCQEIGIKYGSLRSLMSQDKTPRWIKSFNFGYKLGSVKNIEVVGSMIVCHKCQEVFCDEDCINYNKET